MIGLRRRRRDEPTPESAEQKRIRELSNEVTAKVRTALSAFDRFAMEEPRNGTR